MKTTLLAALALVPVAVVPGVPRDAAVGAGAVTSAARPVGDLDVVVVTQSGKAAAALDHVGLETTLVTKAPSAAAALEAHRKGRDRAVAGMRAAGVEVFDLAAGGLIVQPESLDPNQQQFGGMVVINGRLQEPETPDRGFECRQALTFFMVPGADPAATAEVLALAHDTAKELGLSLGPEPDPYGRVSFPMEGTPLATLTYRLADEARAAAVAEAEREALEAARAQAQRLVAWSGRALGPVRAMQAGEPKVTWSGLGAGAEVAVTVTVTFGLER